MFPRHWSPAQFVDPDEKRTPAVALPPTAWRTTAKSLFELTQVVEVRLPYREFLVLLREKRGCRRRPLWSTQ